MRDDDIGYTGLTMLSLGPSGLSELIREMRADAVAGVLRMVDASKPRKLGDSASGVDMCWADVSSGRRITVSSWRLLIFAGDNEEATMLPRERVVDDGEYRLSPCTCPMVRLTSDVSNSARSSALLEYSTRREHGAIATISSDIDVLSAGCEA